MNERTPYKPVKPVDRSSEIDELRKKMEKLYEELEELKREKEELKGSKISLTPQQVQEEMDELIEKAESMVGYREYKFGKICPICGRHKDACPPIAKIEADRIIYGIQCYGDGKFCPRKEVPIPKNILEHYSK